MISEILKRIDSSFHRNVKLKHCMAMFYCITLKKIQGRPSFHLTSSKYRLTYCMLQNMPPRVQPEGVRNQNG